MSTNCINCIKSKRTGPDLLCDPCRAVNQRRGRTGSCLICGEPRPFAVWQDQVGACAECRDRARNAFPALLGDEPTPVEFTATISPDAPPELKQALGKMAVHVVDRWGEVVAKLERQRDELRAMVGKPTAEEEQLDAMLAPDTPETDAEIERTNPVGAPGNTALISTEFARKLERERDILRAKLAAAKAALEKVKVVADRVDDAGGSTWQCGEIAAAALREIGEPGESSQQRGNEA